METPNENAIADAPVNDWPLQHRVMDAMKPVCLALGLSVAQWKQVSAAALTVVLDEVPRAAQRVLGAAAEEKD
jgi:hypothetical protein